MEPLFINKDIQVFTGEEAKILLKKTNDKVFLTKNSGIIKVSKNRWLLAQETEKKHWMVNGIKASDDRNYYHLKHFDFYKALKGNRFNNALEIGCGPFTNTRIIGRYCDIKNCSLLDPLIDDYMGHPFKFYDDKNLLIEYFYPLNKILTRIFPKFYKILMSIYSKKIPIKKKYKISGEELITNELFDLVIMINVIEHCYDIEKVFENIINVTAKGAYFIFEDKLYEHEKVKNGLELQYDATHPLKVDKDKIEKFLSKYFDFKYKNIQPNTVHKFAGNEWDDIYYIGMKKW